MTLDTTIEDLITGLKNLNIEESDFRNSRFIRLKVLQNLIDNNILSDQLRFKK
jgi:hypothetical protein